MNKIDQELNNPIPPLSSEEQTRPEADILKNGILDPIQVKQVDTKMGIFCNEEWETIFRESSLQVVKNLGEYFIKADNIKEKENIPQI